MIFISIVAIVTYLIALDWTWKSLGSIEKTKKVVFVVIGFIIIYIITLIVFQTTKNGINYQNIQMQKDVQNILVIIFTGINSIIIMPQIGKILDKINEESIDDSKQLVKRLLVLLIIFIICLIFESGYMKDIQEGILEIYRSNING